MSFHIPYLIRNKEWQVLLIPYLYSNSPNANSPNAHSPNVESLNAHSPNADYLNVESPNGDSLNAEINKSALCESVFGESA